MEDFKDLDSLFKDTLGNVKVNPPAGVWEGISSSLPAATAAAQTSVWLVAAKWAAGVILAGGIGYVAYTSLTNKTADSQGKTNAIKTQQQPAVTQSGETSTAAGVNANGNSISENPTVDNTPQKRLETTPDQRFQSPFQAESRTGGDLEDPNPVNSTPALTDVHQHNQNVKSSDNASDKVPNCLHTLGISIQKISSTAYSFTAINQSGLVAWNFGDGNAENGDVTSHEYGQIPGVYFAKAYSQSPLGCRDSAQVKITISGPKPDLKNVFTPNGDGLNDLYYVETKNLVYYNLIISDFQNRQVYVSTNPAMAWDGTCSSLPCPEGWYQVTFAYKYPGDVSPQIVKEKLLLTRDKKD